MAIQFKFRSSVNFDSVDIEGRSSISIGDLKSKIIRLKNLDTCQNFDLVFSDAQTGQEFVDDKFKITSGSCVIIKRVPAGSVPSNVVHHNLFGDFQAKDTKIVKPSHPVNAEMEDFDDFGVDLYPICKANSSISHNNTNLDAVRRYKETERGYLGSEGSGFSEAIQGDSSHGTIGGTVLPMESKLNIDEGIALEKPVVAMPSVFDNRDIPSELKCILCKSFFVDAVIIRCCQHSFCEKCIHIVLLEKAKCPVCASTKYKVEDLLPNVSLRQTVAHFLEPPILMGDSDNAHHHNAPDEESVIEGKDMPCFSYATGRGSNQEVVECAHDSSLRRNMNIKADGAEFRSCHPENFGGRPEDLPPDDDCQGESQPVFGDLKHGLLVNASGKKQSIADFRRQKKRDRTCYMCGSLDHFIKDCPAASKPHSMHQMGVMPGYASPWHQVRPFANLYGSPVAFNTLVVPEANSYWASIYGGYPVPSGFMTMGHMTAPHLGKSEEFYAGYSEFVDANDCNKKRKMSNNHMRRVVSFTNEDEGEREDDVAKKKHQHDHDGRSRDYKMLEEREHPRGREEAKDEVVHWHDDEKRKSCHSFRDAGLNRFNDRVNLDDEALPCSTMLRTKARSGHLHKCYRERGGRTNECCSDSSSNHCKRCKQTEANTNRVETDRKWVAQKHHSRSESGLEQSFSSDHKLLQKEKSSISRCSKQSAQYIRDGLICDHRQMDCGSNENFEECNHKYKGQVFVKRNYRSEF